MKTFVRSGVPTASGMAAIVLLVVLGSAVAFSRQEEKPRSKAWLGVSIRDVTESIAKENNLPNEVGAFVAEVVDDSPADSAGIEEGDVIAELNQKKIDDADGLVAAVGQLNPGDKINIVYIHKGEKKTVQVVLGKFPRMRGPRVALERILPRFRVLTDRGSQGMQLMELNSQLSDYFGVPRGTGVLVEKVKKGSAADKAGIKAGDILLKIGKRTIDDMEDVSKAFSRYDEGDKVDVEVSRKGVSKTFSLEIKRGRGDSSFEIFRNGDSGMFHQPPFEEYNFADPHWNGQNYRFEFRDFHPDMEYLEQNLRDMQKSLKDQQHNLLKSVQELRMRSI